MTRGHERDSTVLDEVAHQRYDTPSKVVAGIQALIVKRARESQAMLDEVAGLALRRSRSLAPGSGVPWSLGIGGA